MPRVGVSGQQVDEVHGVWRVVFFVVAIIRRFVAKMLHIEVISVTIVA